MHIPFQILATEISFVLAFDDENLLVYTRHLLIGTHENFAHEYELY